MRFAISSLICGLGFLSSAYAQPVQLDFGGNALASNGAGFTKVGLNNASVVNGSYYEWDYVAGTAFTLSISNIGTWGGTGTLNADGFYNMSGTGPAYFTLSGLPAGNTVTIYACYAWDGSGRGAKVEFGNGTNIITDPGTEAAPSVATMLPLSRAVMDGTGSVNGRWYGQTGFTSEGQVGAMIFDVEPCQPILTLNGINPMLVPINTAFSDPGATAVESCTSAALAVATNGTVDTSTLGTYYVTYSAIADGYSNSVTRTVNVVQSDFLNLELANGSSDGVPTPAGFVRLNRTGANMSFSAASVAGATYTVAFTNVSGSYKGGGSTIDSDGFYCNSGVTCGFSVSGLTPGSLVTLYACWAWDGANNAAIITYAGTATQLTLGSGIASPSPATLQNVGTALADNTGTVYGTWTGKTGHQGQIGGMIFAIQAPVAHTLTVLPSGVTNTCGSSATFIASAASALFQWYDNHTNAIPGGTNATLVLNDLKPSNNGYYSVVAYGSGWAVTNRVVIDMIDIAPPVMTLNGDSTLILAVNSPWNDPGVIAFDSCQGNSLAVTTNGTVNPNVVGEYDLTYSATTADGIPGSITRAVVVIDPTVIATDYQINLDFQSTSDASGTAPGFTALQLFDLLTPSSGDASVVDPTGTGLGYALNFTNITAWDDGPYLPYNNISTAGFLNFNPGGTYLPAGFSLSNLPMGVVVNIYAVYGWSGAAHAATIIYAGKTNLLTTGITTNSPNPPTQADFQFLGSAVALQGAVSGTWYGPGGPATEGQIGGMIINIQSIPAHSVAITPAASSPVCGTDMTLAATVAGITPFTYQWYDNHTNAIAGATNASYTVVSVHPANEGNYTLVAHNAFGSATNFATISGVTDTALPVMTLNGINPVILVVNSGPYADAGATAYDLCAQASLPVSSNNPVDVTAVGSYTVTYSATTGTGNTGTLTRTVNVVSAPNDTLQLDFAPTGTVQPAPAGFTKIQLAAALTPGNYSTTVASAGSTYGLSFTNVGTYNTGNTNEPLTTDGLYSYAADGPAYFALNELPQGARVTLYAIYAWDGAAKYANVFFGGTNTQIVLHGDPGQNPSLANFTKIGSALVGSSGAVTGHWQGPGGPNAEGQVGAVVILVGTNHPPVANNIAMSALSGQPASLKIIGGASAPSDADGDALTVTAVQNPTPHNGTVATDGTSVTYTSAATFAGTDTFTYTVSDGYGGFATVTVTVNVAPAGAGYNRVSAPVLGGGSGQVSYAGIPYSEYALDMATNIAPPVTWIPVVTNQANASGEASFTFTVSQGRAFYRVRSVP
ncbi:MAG TPA: immunoglobulin-like domain-containing protein [Candidatus Acidoferrum sp.]|nr:immunoglobulin-like domain-containing protein [Candidatus Acidoferrum sp.]